MSICNIVFFLLNFVILGQSFTKINLTPKEGITYINKWDPFSVQLQLKFLMQIFREWHIDITYVHGIWWVSTNIKVQRPT